MSVDQEGGRVARLRGLCTDVPAMRVVGRAAAKDPEVPYRLGAMTARELSVLGFHWDFAPVVDVDTNPANPVIGERSFATDAATVGGHRRPLHPGHACRCRRPAPRPRLSPSSCSPTGEFVAGPDIAGPGKRWFLALSVLTRAQPAFAPDHVQASCGSLIGGVQLTC